MNLARRVVLTVALAAAIAVLAHMLTSILLDGPDGGWFMYEPAGSGVPFSPADDASAVWSAVIWLVAIGVWTAIAWRLVRSRPGRSS